MSDYYIGLSGIYAAQKAFNIIGNNIANAATEGYHCQEINLSPAYASQRGSVMIGGGVNVQSIIRLVDDLLEKEILRQNSSLSYVSQECTTLQTIENALGELSTEEGGLNVAIDNFFNTLQDLSVYPSDVVYQTQTLSDAETLASQFRVLGNFLTTLDEQIKLEIENVVDSINTLTGQIAELNSNISRQEIDGTEANNLRDQRDKLITDLSELIGVETLSRNLGIVDVTVGSMPVVSNTSSNDLEASLDENGNVCISIAGASIYLTNLQGGKLGALLSLKNETISDIQDKLDTLASAIIQQVNQYHVQGVGSDGSFTSLTGWTNASGDWSDFSEVTAGSIYIRVIDPDGQITRTEITIDPNDADHDSMSDLAADINAITGLTASVDSGTNKLTITADTNYTFDFIPAVLPEPTSSNLTGTTSPPSMSVSGIYSGSANDTLRFTVVGSDSVGNGSLQLAVTNSDGDSIATVNIGSGYAAGDKITVGDTGITIALTTGDLVNGNSFTVDVFADTDTSGVLASIGINTFFYGDSATTIAVCSDISANVGRIATSIGPDMTDNTNIANMAQIEDESLSSLGSLTCSQYYQQLIADIGQELLVKQTRQDNLEVIIQDLTNEQSEISGVDINEEATQLLVFEQMFQAMAKYLSTVQSSVESLFQII